jgi:hypothetical protein
MGVKKQIKRVLKKVKHWLEEEEEGPRMPELPDMPCDNSYQWLHVSFKKMMHDPVCAKRPQYIWGVLEGAALGKVLGFSRVSVAEFGVAGGAGLLAMERAAELAEGLAGIAIDVYGFDVGVGMPKPQDYRDRPYFWLEGAYPCDQQELVKRLRRAKLRVGLVGRIVPEFLETKPSPIAFAAFDLCFYSSTKDALALYEAGHELLLPRIPSFFRTTIGRTANDYTGERLAISEFNSMHVMRKISPTHGMRWYVPSEQVTWYWPDMFFCLHIFDHPLYNSPQQLRMSTIIDVDGRESFHSPQQWKDIAI